MAATLREIYGSLDANNLEATKSVKIYNALYTEPTFIMLGLSQLLDKLRGNSDKAKGAQREQVEAAIKVFPLLRTRLAVYPALKKDVLKWVGEQRPKVVVATVIATASNGSGPVREANTAPRPGLAVGAITPPR